MTPLLRLELATVVRTRVATASALAAAGLVALFVALASRESAIVAFTGYGRVVTGFGLAAVLVLPLLAIAATAQVVPAARSAGVLEWYLSHPMSRDGCFAGLVAPRLAAVAGPAALAVVGLGVAAALAGAPVSVGVLARLLVVVLGQVVSFVGLGMVVSVGARSAEQALVRGLIVWLACTLLLDFALIGAMLRWDVPPHLVFLLSALDPVQAGRLAVLSTADAELGVLGPVGTWIAATLGPAGTQGYALGYPLVVGIAALAAARRSFRRADL